MSKWVRPGRKRVFVNLKTRLHEALEEAARQNYCSKSEIITRGLLLLLDKYAIRINHDEDDSNY